MAKVESQQKIDDITLINSLNHAINQGINFQDGIQQFAKGLAEVLNCQGTTIYLLDQDKTCLVMQNMQLSSKMTRTIERLIGGEIPKTTIQLGEKSIYRRIIESGKAHLIDDPTVIQAMMTEFAPNAALKKIVPLAFKLLKYRSIFIIPLIFEGEAVGVIDVSAERVFTKTEQERLQAIAGQLTVLVKRKQWEESLQQRNRELTLLNRVIASATATLEPEIVLETTCRELAKAFGVPQAGATLLNETGSTLRLVAEYMAGGGASRLGAEIPVVGNPATQFVLEKKAPLAVIDAQNDPRMAPAHELMRQRGVVSILLLPLIVGNRVVGTVGLDAMETRQFTDAEIALANSAVATAAQVLEKAQLLAAQQRNASLLTDILELSTNLSRLRDENELLDMLVSRTAAFTGSATCTVLLIDESTNEAVLKAQSGLPGGTPPDLRVPLTLPLISRSLETGEPIIIPDIDRDAPQMRAVLLHPGVQAFFACPLSKDGKTMGFMTLSALAPHTPSTAEVTAYRLLAERVAVALEKIRLFKAEQQRSSELAHANDFIATLSQAAARIAASSSIEQAMKTLGRELKTHNLSYLLALSDTDDDSLTPHYNLIQPEALALTEGLSGEKAGKFHWSPDSLPIYNELVNLQRPVLIEDFASIVHSSLPTSFQSTASRVTQLAGTFDKTPSVWLPLVVEDRTLGILTLLGKDLEVSDLQASLVFAGQVAATLANARLITEMQQQAAYLETLHEVDLAISSSLEPEERFQTIVEHAAYLLDCDIVNLFQWDPETREAVGLATYGVSRSKSIKGERVPESASALLPALLASPQVIAIPDVSQDERVLPTWQQRFEGQAMMALPLLYREETIGFLMLLDTRSIRQWSRNEVGKAMALATQVAIAVANARLFTVERQRKAHFEALNIIITRANAVSELSDSLEVVLDNILAALKLQRGVVWTRARQVAVRGFTQKDLDDWATAIRAAGWRMNQSIIVEDWQTEMPAGSGVAFQSLADRLNIRASLSVPILSDGNIIGGIDLVDQEPRRWSQEEISLAEAVGQALGGTAERLRLLETTQLQARQMQQIMDTMSEGLLLLDAECKVVLANPIARDYLELLTEFETECPLVHLGDRSLETLMRPPQPGTLFHEIKLGSTSQRLFEVTPHALETGPQAGGGLLVLREVTQERQQILYRQTQERLASVGQLAAGIAHDFNNIMGVIVLYSQLVQKNAELSSKNWGYMNTIHHQAQHAAKLTEQILDFSRRSVMERRPMNMVHFMKELMQLWRRTLPENIDFSLAHSAREHNINADPTRLQQVMMNLAVNARHAMPNGGVFRIVLEDVALKPDQATPLPDMPAGDWLKIAVSDTGEGVHPEALPHVFEPFFTTKTPDKGTGLGLAQVYGIVKQHDGYIDVTSQVGKGTTFIIYLPSLAINDDAPQELEPRITAKGNQETILIVEDASAMREALSDTLEALNYTTLVAQNGKDALALFKQHADSIALVLSDVVMPEMDGLVLAGKLKELKPDVKIVMMSGYPLQNDGPGPLRQEITAWVQKPFDDKRIAEVLKKTLTP